MDTKSNRLLTALKNHKLSMKELCEKVKMPKDEVEKYIDGLRKEGINVSVSTNRSGKSYIYHVNLMPERNNVYFISGKQKGSDIIRFAATSDWHIGSTFHLPKTWNEAMSRTEDAGIKKVYVAGDITDGDNIYHGHIENLSAVGVERQTDAVAKALSKHPNLEFWGIAGNHDYSFTKQNGVKPLAVLEAKADNFKNLGDLQADVVYKGIKIRLLHGASGRSYAISYPSQTYLRDYFKGLERGEFGEVPHLIILGHYHTLYDGKDHGIHILQPASFQDGKNEYCIRRGLTGANGLYHVELETTDGDITSFNTKFIQPRIAEREKGSVFARTARSYKR